MLGSSASTPRSPRTRRRGPPPNKQGCVTQDLKAGTILKCVHLLKLEEDLYDSEVEKLRSKCGLGAWRLGMWASSRGKAGPLLAPSDDDLLSGWGDIAGGLQMLILSKEPPVQLGHMGFAHFFQKNIDRIPMHAGR